MTTPILVGLVQKIRTKTPCTNSLSIVRWDFVQVVFSGYLLSFRFCPGWVLSVPPSVRIHLLQQKIKHHFKFQVSYVWWKYSNCDVTGSWPLPLSQTVTPSRTSSPSSVRYFIDGPFYIMYVGRLCMFMYVHYQRRQSGLKSEGVVDPGKKCRFSRKNFEQFQFFQVILKQIRFSG